MTNMQDKQLDVTMLISNMIAEDAAKKPPVGQGGRDYEEQINDILKKHGKADKDAKTAGSSADAPDAQFNHAGKKHNLEIKADSKAMFGQIELKHDGEKWDVSETSKKKYPETYKSIKKTGFIEKVNKQWKKPTGDYNEDLKMGNVYHDHPDASPIKAHYGKDRKTDYVQIGKGHGFYHTGNDAAKLGSPELEGKTQLRARMKNRGTDKKTGKTKYGALVVMSLKDAPKSHHDLESQVHKEWIDYVLNGPKVISEEVVQKPIEPGDNENHHIIHMHVSKDGKQVTRAATVTTTHGEAHAIKKAYKHYEDQGYKVHGHKVMKELEEIEKEVPVKESLDEGLGRGREDDEYHTPDPTTRTHKIAFDVSKEGGEKHNRTVTISNSTKSHEEAKKVARAHLEKQGYKIHESVEVDEGLKPQHNMRPGWMIKADPKLKAAIDAKKAKRKEFKELVGKKTNESTELDEAVAKGHTMEAHGVKGVKNTPWRKSFKSHEHAHEWAEKNDAEIHGTRDLEHVKNPAIKEARMTAAMKLQKAFQREQEKRESEKKAGEELLKKTNESVELHEDVYAKAEENKRSAEAAKSQARPFDYHMHMADHHDNMSQWHASKGRHGEAEKHAQKSDEHHEKAMTVKEEVVAEAMVGNWTSIKNKSGNTIHIKSNTDSSKRHTFNIHLSKTQPPIEKNKLNRKTIADRHHAGEFDTFFKEETIHVGYRNSKGDWIKTSSHANYPAAKTAMDDLKKSGKKGVQHRYDNGGSIDPGMRTLAHEEVAVNSVSGGGVAGLQGDAGKKSVMTKPPMKRQLKSFKEGCDCWKNYKRKPGTKPCAPGSCVKEDNELDEVAIDAKGHKSSTGGLTQKGVDAYRRENPGSKLQTAVTTKPSKLKPGSKDANRRKSFCARMSGVDGPMKDENGKPTRKALALRKWNC